MKFRNKIYPAFLFPFSILAHLCRVDSSTSVLWTSPFPLLEMSGYFLSPSFIYIPTLNANNVDPDQSPRSVASDVGLHRLPMSYLWDARLKWVQTNTMYEGLDKKQMTGKAHSVTCTYTLQYI